MLQKKLVEIFALLLFWFVFAYYAYDLARQHDVIKWDLANNLSGTFETHALAIILFIMGYMIFYHVIMCIYVRGKIWSITMWYNVQHPKQNVPPGVLLQQYDSHTLDSLDGRRPNRSQLKQQAHMYISHEKLAHSSSSDGGVGGGGGGSSSTLPKTFRSIRRCAPPVPTSRTLPRAVNQSLPDLNGKPDVHLLCNSSGDCSKLPHTFRSAPFPPTSSTLPRTANQSTPNLDLNPDVLLKRQQQQQIAAKAAIIDV